MRVFLIVLDGVGIGELPDAAEYGDEGSNSLANTAEVVNLALPTMEALGLGRIAPIRNVRAVANPLGSFGKLQERSRGKDTTTGHWELAGIVLEKPFPTYPEGFPQEVMAEFEQAIGRKTLGNYPASGTQIIQELGKEHLETGKPIVYTSADSVFQIACHEEVVSPEELYEMCKIARSILQGPHAVSRVIARPFVGEPGNFKRTERRRDFSLPPPRPTLLDAVKEARLDVLAVGKVEDIFAGRGITESFHTKDSRSTMEQVIKLAGENWQGLLFANCIDTDMLWGHRNDPQGYADSLAMVDGKLGELLPALGPEDVLVVTSDHGCDPTTESTDHSREYTPLLVCGEKVKPKDLGTRFFSDLGATAAEYLQVKYSGEGESFWQEISKL